MNKTTLWYEALTAKRRALGVKQQDLAARLGVSPQTLSRWEGGHHKPLGIYRTAWEKELARLEARATRKAGAK